MWERTGKLLRSRQKPGAKKFPQEMNLKEATEAEQKYFKWLKKYKYDELEKKVRSFRAEKDLDVNSWWTEIEDLDHQMIVYRYQNYLKPRIEYLQEHSEEDPTDAEIDVTTDSEAQNDDSTHYALMSRDELKKIEKETQEWLQDNLHRKRDAEWIDKKSDYDAICFWLSKKTESLLNQAPDLLSA